MKLTFVNLCLKDGCAFISVIVKGLESIHSINKYFGDFKFEVLQEMDERCLSLKQAWLEFHMRRESTFNSLDSQVQKRWNIKSL